MPVKLGMPDAMVCESCMRPANCRADGQCGYTGSPLHAPDGTPIAAVPKEAAAAPPPEAAPAAGAAPLLPWAVEEALYRVDCEAFAARSAALEEKHHREKRALDRDKQMLDARAKIIDKQKNEWMQKTLREAEDAARAALRNS